MSFDRIFQFDLRAGQLNEFLLQRSARFLGIGFVPLQDSLLEGFDRHRLVVWAAVDMIDDRLVAQIMTVTTGVPIDLRNNAIHIGSAVQPGTDVVAHAFLVGWRKNGQNPNV